MFIVVLLGVDNGMELGTNDFGARD